MGIDRDKQGRIIIKYSHSHTLRLHKLLSKKRISQTHLSNILNVSQPSSAIALINKPYNLTFQHMINLSYMLDISIEDMIYIIRDNILNCASSFNPELLDFVPPHLRELKQSADWVNR